MMFFTYSQNQNESSQYTVMYGLEYVLLPTSVGMPPTIAPPKQVQLKVMVYVPFAFVARNPFDFNVVFACPPQVIFSAVVLLLLVNV